MITNRRRFLVKTGGAIAGVGLAVVDAPNVIAQPKVQWRMSTTWTPALDHLQGAAQRLAKVVEGLARHIELVGRPLCPCNFYPDPHAEAKQRRWICACDEMQKYKYCHCLLFVNEEGFPITEHLPEDHEGREAYGIIRDPNPDKGRAMAKVQQRQKEGES